jgi:23S rRNA pseudouridine1911/1915/1917 synthase
VSSPGGPFIIGAEDDGARLDAVLARLTGVSRSRIAAWIDDGRVTVDGRKAGKPSDKCRAGHSVAVNVPEPRPIEAIAQDIELRVVYEDAELIVVDKAPGLVVHPAPGHDDGTLVNALLHHCSDLRGVGDALRPGIVHRIDKDTSGLLVVSKTDRAHSVLQAQFAAHSVARRYEALAARVSGAGLADAGRIESRHGRSPNDRRKFTGAAGPRHAITDYRVLERFADGAIRVECRLKTGRTHQVRMHLAEAGCPILHDELYGGAAIAGTSLIGRLALHAAELGFVHPDGQTLHFEAPLWPDMAAALEKLRRGASWRH